MRKRGATPLSFSPKTRVVDTDIARTDALRPYNGPEKCGNIIWRYGLWRQRAGGLELSAAQPMFNILLVTNIAALLHIDGIGITNVSFSFA